MGTNMDFAIKDGRLEKYYGKGGDVVIPDGVDYITYNAFRGCSEVSGVKIPGSVRSIGYFAFLNCTSLKRVDIAEGVSRIQLCAFRGCKNLERVTLPNGLRHFEKDVFLECDSLKSIICSKELIEILDDKLIEKTVFEFPRRFNDGLLSEEEKHVWFEVIEEHAERCFGLMKDDPQFLYIALSHCSIGTETVEKLIENTESIECRALLLDYKRRKTTENGLKGGADE